jgi:hypothetical protein
MPDLTPPVDLAALRESYAARVPGWSAPVAWALELGDQLVVNAPGGKHGLSALSLGVALGHDGSTATLAVTPEQAGEAARLLEPAAVDTTMRHPNLEALRTSAGTGQPLQVVFVRDLSDPVTSELDARLRNAVASA